MNFTILRFDKLGSTNTEAAEQARHGAPEGLCVIAREQTEGRGRHGRKWHSAADSGLFFSIVLRPKLGPAFLPLITLMAGVAVFDTISDLGVKPDIKWVNDLLVNEKKIGGILAETVETASGIAVVVGVGINLTTSGSPKEIADISTSISSVTGKDVSADEVAHRLTRSLDLFYGSLSMPGGPAEILRAWEARSTYFSGKPVTVTLHDRQFSGVTDGLEANGALRVKLDDGSVTIIQSGDVERLRHS